MIYRAIMTTTLIILGLSGCVYDGHYGNVSSTGTQYQSSYRPVAKTTTYIYHDNGYAVSDYSHHGSYTYERREYGEKKLSKKERKRKEQQERDLAFINEKLEQLERAGERFDFKKPSDF